MKYLSSHPHPSKPGRHPGGWVCSHGGNSCPAQGKKLWTRPEPPCSQGPQGLPPGTQAVSRGQKGCLPPQAESSVTLPGPPQTPACLTHSGNEVANTEGAFVPSPQEAHPRSTRKSPEQTRTLLPQRQKEKQPSHLHTRPGPAPLTCSR